MWLYIALALIALVYYLFKSLKYDHWEKKGVLTASGNEWFFGHVRPMMMVEKHMNEVFEAMYKEFPDAPIVGYYMMGVPSLMVNDLDMIKAILISEFSSFNFSGLSFDKKADPLAAAHPFMLKGEEWKTARTQVNPSISLAKLKGYLPNMLKVGDEMVKYLRKNCDPTVELETRELSMMYGTDVIATAICGIENNTFLDKDSLVANITREIQFETSVAFNIKMILQQIPIINWFFPARFASQRLQNVIMTLTRRVVEQRIKSGEKRNDLIQLLLTQRENDTKGVVDDVYMSAQVFIVILDLYETSSNAISAMLYLLSKHSEVQDRLRSEIKEISSRNNGEFTIEDIEGAKYLDMVFNETFRLFALVIPRECTSDCYVPVPGSEPIKITKGTPISIPVNGIHKDPKYYPDPEKFDPDRFSEEEVAKRPRFTYMPFGEGPKKCIDNKKSKTASGSEWFFGHFKPIFLVKKHLVDVYQAMYKEYPDAPMIGYYNMMNVPALMIKDLDIIKTILISEFSNFKSNGVVLAAMYSTDVVANAIYGVANNTFENKDSLFVNLTKEMNLENSVSGNINLFLQHLPILNWIFPARFTPRKLRDLRIALSSRIIKEIVETSEKRNDLIQLLLTHKNDDTKGGIFKTQYM